MIKKLTHSLFVVLIIIWLVLATLRIVNYYRILFFTDLQKKTGVASEDRSYYAMKKLSARLKDLPDNEVYVYSTREGRDFFLLRYFAYPNKVYWDEEKRVPDNVGVAYIE